MELSLVFPFFSPFTLSIAFGSFTVHTGAGLIIPEIQDDGKVFMG